MTLSTRMMLPLKVLALSLVLVLAMVVPALAAVGGPPAHSNAGGGAGGNAGGPPAHSNAGGGAGGSGEVQVIADEDDTDAPIVSDDDDTTPGGPPAHSNAGGNAGGAGGNAGGGNSGVAITNNPSHWETVYEGYSCEKVYDGGSGYVHDGSGDVLILNDAQPGENRTYIVDGSVTGPQVNGNTGGLSNAILCTDPASEGPGSNGPDSNDPDSNDPDSNDPDSNDPDSNDPDSNDPDSNDPDSDGDLEVSDTDSDEPTVTTPVGPFEVTDPIDLEDVAVLDEFAELDEDELDAPTTDETVSDDATDELTEVLDDAAEAGAEEGAVAAAQLERTGVSSAVLALIGALSLLAGAALLRRRPATATSEA